MSNEIYLIDGSAFIYRAFHAVAPLTNSSGFQTNAVFGFISIVKKLLKERQPTHVAVAFDSRGPVFRHEMYAEYKANRPPMPEELAGQIPYIKKAVQALGLRSFEENDVEADDIIASAAKTLCSKGNRVVIVSGDKDLLQLVGDDVTMWDPMKNKLMDNDAVVAKYKVAPNRLLDCFALIGDSSDNVPGVPGVGSKSAEKLINQFGSLDELYDQVDTLKKSKMKERLIENRQQAFLARRLIRLKLDVAVPADPDEYQLGEPDVDQLKELYTDLGFSSLLKDLDSGKPIPIDGFSLVIDQAGLKALEQAIQGSAMLAIDTETTSLNSRIAKLVGLSLSIDTTRCWYIPVGHCHEDGTIIETQLPVEEVKQMLAPFLLSSSLSKVGHNIKYDYGVIKQTLGIELAGPLIDTMIAAYLAEPARRSFKLDDLCRDFDLTLTSYDTVTAGDKREDAFSYVPIEKAFHYSCEDVYGTLVLWEHYGKLLKQKGQKELFTNVEMPLVPILAEMEHLGIRVDSGYLDDLEEQFSEKLKVRESDIYQQAGHEFNINSPQQLGKILFEELGLPHGRKTKTGYSTDMKVLEKLAAKHEIPALIMEYRNLAKLLSTYVEKLSHLIDAGTGRVHTSFNQTVTATGRLSSSNPNLQNIPIRGEEGYKIRRAFVPENNNIFLFADYSQIDLRVLAHYSQDPALLKAFRNGDDIHTRTAAEIFSVSHMLVTSEMRRVAKSINFGIVYGMSSFGLSTQLRISRREAQKFIDRYFTLYAGVKQFMADIINQARADGYVTTLLKRRRYLPEIDAANKVRREFSERAAINTPIQGTAADIIKLAMLKVQELLKHKKSSCRMLLQIHDELVFELTEADCHALKKDICKAMEQALEIDVPLVVNMEVGTSLAK